MKIFKPIIIICIFILTTVGAVVFYDTFYTINRSLQITGVSDFNGKLIYFNNQSILFSIFSLFLCIIFILLITIIFQEYINNYIAKFYTKNKSETQPSSLDNEEFPTEDVNKNELIKDEETTISEEKIMLQLKDILKDTKEIKLIGESILSVLADAFNIVQGELFLRDKNQLNSIATYAYYNPEGKRNSFEVGKGLIGQVAKDKKLLNVDNVPDGYITTASGLGNITPNNLIIFPIINNDNVVAIFEISSFNKFTKNDEIALTNISDLLKTVFSG